MTEPKLRFSILFPLIGLGLCLIGYQHGGWTWVLLWPVLSCFLVGIAYVLKEPRFFGKGADGTMAGRSVVLFFPYLIFNWGLWHVVRFAHGVHSSERYASEIAPSVWVSRRVGRSEIPKGVTCVVDMTCEFPAARGLVKSVQHYFCLPTLDYGAPRPEEAFALIEKLRVIDGGVLIHCAQGHGRSAMLAGAFLVAMGSAKDADDAMRIVKIGRVKARISPEQRIALGVIVDLLRHD